MKTGGGDFEGLGLRRPCCAPPPPPISPPLPPLSGLDAAEALSSFRFCSLPSSSLDLRFEATRSTNDQPPSERRSGTAAVSIGHRALDSRARCVAAVMSGQICCWSGNAEVVCGGLRWWFKDEGAAAAAVEGAAAVAVEGTAVAFVVVASFPGLVAVSLLPLSPPAADSRAPPDPAAAVVLIGFLAPELAAAAPGVVEVEGTAAVVVVVVAFVVAVASLIAVFLLPVAPSLPPAADTDSLLPTAAAVVEIGFLAPEAAAPGVDDVITDAFFCPPLPQQSRNILLLVVPLNPPLLLLLRHAARRATAAIGRRRASVIEWWLSGCGGRGVLID